MRPALNGIRLLLRRAASTIFSRTTNGKQNKNNDFKYMPLPFSHLRWFITCESWITLLSSLYFLSIKVSDSDSLFDLPILNLISSRWRQKCFPSETERVVKKSSPLRLSGSLTLNGSKYSVVNHSSPSG